MRVLFVGNSYTHYNDMPGIVARLAHAAGEAPFEPAMITRGGAMLKVLYEQTEARDRIAEGGWDHVVLQEQSRLPVTSPQTMHASVRVFAEEIRNAGAKPVLYLTWARKDRPRDQDALDDAYLAIAREIDAAVIPAGPAFRRLLGEVELHLEDNRHPTAAGSYTAACAAYGTFYGRSAEGLDVRTVHQTRPKRKIELDAKTAEVIQREAWGART